MADFYRFDFDGYRIVEVGQVIEDLFEHHGVKTAEIGLKWETKVADVIVDLKYVPGVRIKDLGYDLTCTPSEVREFAYVLLDAADECDRQKEIWRPLMKRVKSGDDGVTDLGTSEGVKSNVDARALRGTINDPALPQVVRDHLKKVEEENEKRSNTLTQHVTKNREERQEDLSRGSELLDKLAEQANRYEESLKGYTYTDLEGEQHHVRYDKSYDEYYKMSQEMAQQPAVYPEGLDEDYESTTKVSYDKAEGKMVYELDPKELDKLAAVKAKYQKILDEGEVEVEDYAAEWPEPALPDVSEYVYVETVAHSILKAHYNLDQVKRRNYGAATHYPQWLVDAARDIAQACINEREVTKGECS